MDRRKLGASRRWVVKIGSALLTASGRGLDHERIADWVAQIAALRDAGHEIAVVSSGAVAEGLVRLGWDKRPQALNQLQAAASVGQMGLVEAYERQFQRHGLRTAQVLLTHDEVADRRRYLNARSTLLTLLQLGVIPVVNENDAVATEEIRLGDNDTLAAMTVNLIDADLLVILTDQAGMYDADPRANPDATLIDQRPADDPDLQRMAGGGSGTLGRGGMRTKVQAAVQAARSGAATVIADGLTDGVLQRLAEGQRLGTLLTPGEQKITARKRWIASQRQTRGRVRLDAGAARALREGGRSLLPIGITAVEGEFRRGDIVACLDPEGREIARGMANYDAREARALAGKGSDEIAAVLGYTGEPEFIHRDNSVIL
ncbi:glutamate 5-kinase [Salinisphaera sp. PC39]|uniref:glutamate 5-kinase n=1 Tax=Salinisphaera sp. PC39 TaxID=1304156 RepID=UPI00333EE8BE